MKVLIAGDLVITAEYNLPQIDEDIVSLFSQSDLNIVNLEAPVTNSTSKLLKTGPHLKSDKKHTAFAIKTLKVGVTTLANNHVLDYGDKGVADTLEFCRKNDVKTVGVGMDLSEASETLFINTKEGVIAVVNIAENEWASATDNNAGTNPMNIIDNTIQINIAKKKADFVIVIIHGGHEYYNLPSPRMQKQYRFYANQGADIIVGHHTHCISGSEIYNDVPIYYSLGNFLFTMKSNKKDWFTGLVLEIDIKGGVLKTKIHPVKQDDKTFRLSFLKDKERQDTINRIANFNSTIENYEDLNNNWEDYVKSMSKSYLNYWSLLSFIPNRYIKAILRRLPFQYVNKSNVALFLNLMRCEAHSDISKEILKKHLER